jgi:hypothetical protein
MWKLRVRENARQDGRRDLPTSDSTKPSDTEQAIHSEFAIAAARIEREWGVCLGRRWAEINKQEYTVEETDYQTPIDVALGGLTRNRQEGRAQIRHAWEREQDEAGELEAFKDENELSRNAHYPAVPLLTMALILLIFVLETAANAWLFSNATDWGLLGGAGYAALMSLPNILGGLIVGFFGLRGSLHVNWFIRSLGIVLTALGGAGMLFWNYYVGHFRALLATRPETELGDFRGVMQQIRLQPLAVLDTTDALLLMIVGLIVAAIAIWEGFDGFSDRYPGYAKMDKALRKASEALQAAIKAYRDSIARIVGKAEGEIKRKRASIDLKQRRVQEIVKATVVDLKGFEEELAATAHACRTALNVYRRANRKVRRTRAPQFFGEYPTFRENLPNSKEFDAEAVRARVQATARQAHESATRALHELHEHQSKFLNDVDNVIAEASREAEQGGRRGRRPSSREDQDIPLIDS